MNKEEVEQALGNASVKPVHRTKWGNYEILVAEGFITPDQLKYLHRFGITATKDEYPVGALVTYSLVPWKAGYWSECCLFDPNHDPAYSASSRAKMRINTAVQMAIATLKKNSGLKLN